MTECNACHACLLRHCDIVQRPRLDPQSRWKHLQTRARESVLHQLMRRTLTLTRKVSQLEKAFEFMGLSADCCVAPAALWWCASGRQSQP